MQNAFGIERRIIDHNVVWMRGDVRAGGPSDTTRLIGGIEDYDPKCSACWLNHGHSGDYHDQQVEQANERERIHLRDLRARQDTL